ncbi:GatB/YqeY domain-containing protein [Urinicoccus massiliensis]|uniref:GatB/YqeY domain-containing protein n=1 Tax=Urinicoccus massiliensis TaxID=1723382 RepID=UPI00050E263C|nr:GatB/YqeY domain-containing protein [Urinicoccus massiliensis]KGF10702.1 aspartyl-tRNA amidotransferase [Tissierellia bacterium S5-A11]
MSLKEELMADLKKAMKEKDKQRKDTITMVRAAIKQKEVDERVDLKDEDVLAIISKQVKEKKKSIDEFKKGNRQDLVDATEAEIEILYDYLPKQLSEDELKDIVQETISRLSIHSKKDMGRLMQDIMPRIKGQADGQTINRLAQEFFTEE